MNYRHGYHVGNVADVLKHYVLGLLLTALRAKPAPFFVLDTHAGAGLYTLGAEGEYQQGAGLLWPLRTNWPDLADYFATISTRNGRGRMQHYPGSPLFIQRQLRPQDRAAFVEKHPEEHAPLRMLFEADRRIGVHLGDGWHLIKAFTPPPERRGLVLIDPPYEQGDDGSQIIQAVTRALQSWRMGMYCIWYPIKSQLFVQDLLRDLARLIPAALSVQLWTLSGDVDQRLNGSGLIIINPPWKIAQTLERVLPPVARILAGPRGQPQVYIESLRDQAFGRPRRLR